MAALAAVGVYPSILVTARSLEDHLSGLPLSSDPFSPDLDHRLISYHEAWHINR